MTRVTILGAILIVALVLVLLIAIDILIEQNKPDQQIEGK